MFVGWLDGFGNTVLVYHGGGWMTQYSHLESFDVSVGQTVRIGQTVAHSGHTGAGTGPHLHFGAIKGSDGVSIHSGYEVDPHKFIGY